MDTTQTINTAALGQSREVVAVIVIPDADHFILHLSGGKGEAPVHSCHALTMRFNKMFDQL